MDKWEGHIKYAFILIFAIYLDLVIFGPIIEDFVELGLNNEITIGGVTASVKAFLGPILLNFYRLMWHIIAIIGWLGIVWRIQHYLKKIKIL